MAATHVIEISCVGNSSCSSVASFWHDTRSCSSLRTACVRDGGEVVPLVQWSVGDGYSVQRSYRFFRREIQPHHATIKMLFLDHSHLAKQNPGIYDMDADNDQKPKSSRILKVQGKSPTRYQLEVSACRPEQRRSDSNSGWTYSRERDRQFAPGQYGLARIFEILCQLYRVCR